MLNILIDHSGYELQNFGDSAMLKTGLVRLHNLWPHARLIVFTNHPAKLHHLYPKAQAFSTKGRDLLFKPGASIGISGFSYNGRLFTIESFLHTHFPKFMMRWITFSRLKNSNNLYLIRDFINMVKNIDAFVITGGGFITDVFTRHAVNVLLTANLAQSLDKPTACFGQGIGPIQNKNLLSICKTVLSKMEIIGLREGLASLSLLKALNIDAGRISVTGDDAVELAYRSRKETLGDSIGVNIREAKYSEVDRNITQSVVKVISQFAQINNTPLIPIPVSFYASSSDLNAVRFSNLIPESEINKAASIHNPDDLIEQVSRCRLVITGSYHAGVFALSQGIPVIGLVKSRYYAAKFQGLTDQFGTGCQVVMMEADSFPDDLANTIRNIWTHAPEFQEELLISSEMQIQRSQKVYTKFYNCVTSMN